MFDIHSVQNKSLFINIPSTELESVLPELSQEAYLHVRTVMIDKKSHNFRNIMQKKYSRQQYLFSDMA